MVHRAAATRTRSERREARSLSQALSLHQAGRLSRGRGALSTGSRDRPRVSSTAVTCWGWFICSVAIAWRRSDNSISPWRSSRMSPPPITAGLPLSTNSSDSTRRSACCDRALALKPDLAEALTNRGLALIELKRFDGGAGRAATRRSRCVRTWRKRSTTAAMRSGSSIGPVEALASYDRAIALRPDYAEAFNNRANVLNQLRRFDEALESAERAIALRPDLAQAHYNRGIALHELKRFEDALASYDAAVAHAPEHAEALVNRGTVLVDLGRYDEACASYARALALDPGQKYLKGMHLHARMLICDWTSFDAQSADLNRAVGEGAVASLPHHLLPCSSDPRIQLICAKSFMQDKIGAAFVPLWRGERYSHARIRLAYLSSDFARSCGVAARRRPVRASRPGSFETVAISSAPAAPSAMRTRLEAASSGSSMPPSSATWRSRVSSAIWRSRSQSISAELPRGRGRACSRAARRPSRSTISATPRRWADPIGTTSWRTAS